MTTRKIYILLIPLLFFLGSCSNTDKTRHSKLLPKGTPVADIKPEFTVDEWLVAGPFPNKNLSEPLEDGTYDSGYSEDFLISLGGESQAKLAPEKRIEFTNESGTKSEVNVIPATANEIGIVDFSKIFHNAENKVAYAFAYLRSPKDRTVYFLLGSDDAVKVWVNGELVHENYTFRAINAGDDRFPVHLKAGLNPILVKVLNGVREWGFVLSIVDEKRWEDLKAKEDEEKEFRAFLNCKIVPDWYNVWDEQFYPGDFPQMRWDQPLLAEKVIGKAPLKVRWFDENLNELQKAEQPGRYLFVAECTSKDGKNIRRAGTLYCWPDKWIGWSERPFVSLEPLAAARFDKKIWKQHEKAIGYNVGRLLLLSTLYQEEGAALMSYLYEMNKGKYENETLDNPLLLDDEYHIRLQKKIGGILYNGPSLNPPAVIEGEPAPVLRPGSPAEAGFKNSIIADVDRVCREWYEASGEPFITLIARNGVIVYHKAVGKDASAVFTTETATPMASITKLITGVTFAQFVQQGLIRIDDPVGKFFPDFPVSGDKALTLRHCFTHTSGLTGHESWGGVHNHRLENIVASQLDRLPVGKRHTYNGDGYDLAGRVMEAVAGKSIFRVIKENLLDPLGMDHSTIDEDLAFSLHSTAGDMARVGQMLLNKGSYGKYEFFSPEVFEQLLPKNLSQFYPGLNLDWGIGITWMRTTHPDAGKNGIPEGKTILSPNIIGHGSATSAVLRVDLDNKLVITQTRRRGGAHYNQYLTELLLAVEKNLK